MTKKMQHYIDLIENNFDEFLLSENEEIKNAMEYSLKAGGKRLRPILLLEFAKMLEIPEKDALPYAISLEMIHTYSLIHDDLPCMDNDDFRRGKPTNHKVFGEALALLAGDGLLNLAFETMSDERNASKFQAKNVVKVISEISKSTGVLGMISGQVFDIDDNVSNICELQKIHSLKTGKLIKCACVSGVILGGGTDEQIKSAEDFAMNLGIAFQIRDDMLDVYGDSEKLGKPVGSDENNKKVTYTSIFSKDECQKMVEEYTQNAINSIGIFKNTEFLKNLALSLVNREK
ncbi:MAG: farnesyl diphosphate synthase [Clostridia bacterium]